MPLPTYANIVVRPDLTPQLVKHQLDLITHHLPNVLVYQTDLSLNSMNLSSHSSSYQAWSHHTLRIRFVTVGLLKLSDSDESSFAFCPYGFVTDAIHS